MAKAKVWYANARGRNFHEAIEQKAKWLFYEAGLNECIDKGDWVAVKIHVGEHQVASPIRPHFVKAIVEEVQKCGGEPFVTDTTTLPYMPTNNRCIAITELIGAYRHGITPDAMGCPVIIADGLEGEDDVRVEIPEGLISKETYIGRAIAEADAMITVTHGKGHAVTAYGGAIKNIGIGGQSKRGKYNTHLAMWGTLDYPIGWPLYDPKKCPGRKCPFWEVCEESCPEDAITVPEKGPAELDFSKCRLCFGCQVLCLFCATGAIGFTPEFFPLAQISMADTALGCLKTKDKGKVGHISYVFDTAPICDCFPWSDVPITPHIGVFASKDIVAIDTASLDLIDKAPIGPWSRAEELGLKPGDDKYKAVQGFTPRIQLRAGEKIGMGTTDYELVEFTPTLTPDTQRWGEILYHGKYPVRWYAKMLKRHHLMKEVEPFKKTPFEKRPKWEDFAK